MRIGLVAVVGLMVVVGAQAQQSTQAQQNMQARQSAPYTTQQFIDEKLLEAEFALEYRDCPGALRAQHQSVGPTIWTVALEDRDRDSQAQKVKGPGVHVVFETKPVKTAMNKVKALELSVSYLPAGARVMPVEPGLGTKSAKESKKTFVLQQEAARELEADLLVGPAATITHVHLVSVTFADGNVWRAASEDECSVTPSLYMPVEAKR